MKKIFLIICMLLLCLAVTSCGNGGNKYQKGWDRYCKDGAAMSGKTLQ
jgi:ABC-type Fe3+-citrate transport system substrate-binding protein